MIIAAAQTKPAGNNTNQNITDHLRLIDMAAEQGAELILFPEMSLTGYQREQAEELCFVEDDPRLDPIKEKANLYKMMIIVGAPIKINEKLHIGAFILLPGNKSHIYTKQFLHGEEENYFSGNNNYNPLVSFNEEQISIAICADITNPVHAHNAAEKKSSLYLAGIFYTPGGISKAYEQLGSYSKNYGMKILMSNYGGPSYNIESAGESASWNENGDLIGKITNHEKEILIVQI